MEYADGGDLLGKINQHKRQRTRFTEDEVWSIALQMLQALRQLHDMRVLHRDLKVRGRQCANVFLCKDGTTKIGDLNVSKVSQRGLAYTQTGTPYYASPEVWKDQPYDSKSDIWSVGCVLYEAASLNPPFRAQDMNELYNRVTRGAYAPMPSHFSEELHDLVRSFLQVDPKQRPSCAEVLRNPALTRRIQSRASNRGGGSSLLLGTIELPRNIALLHNKLPGPNYEQRSKPSSRSSEPVVRRMEVEEPPVTHLSPTHLKSGLRNAGRNLVMKQPSRAQLPSRERPLLPRDQPPSRGALRPSERPRGPPMPNDLLPPMSRDLPPRGIPMSRDQIPPKVPGREMVTGNREYGRFAKQDPMKLPQMPKPVLHRPREPGQKPLSNRIGAIRAQYEKNEVVSSRRQLVRPSVDPGWWG
jgi:serine/threonine protein kinase